MNTVTNEMVKQYIPIVKSIAGKLFQKTRTSYFQYEDLVGFGYEGLMDAFKKYDPSKNACFVTYASIRIRGAILDSIRNLSPISVRRKKQRGVTFVSIDDPVRDENHEDLFIRDLLTAPECYEPEHVLEEKEVREFVAGVIKKYLTAKEWTVLYHHFIKGETHRQIVDRFFRCTESRISQIKTRSIKKLRRALEVQA
jgi:RNA polymerase sigma factor (sigma-70 family)